MTDYQPFDLSAHCNTGAAFAGPNIEPLHGQQSFHGLPFLIGAAQPDSSTGSGVRCFIGFGE